MRQRYGEIQDRGADVVAISFEPRDRLFQLTRQLQLPFPILSDPERDVYSAYSLAQGSWLKIFSPKTVWTYVKHFARGRRYQHAASDWKQLGGDFVIGEDGTVLYEHRGQTPSDRPTVASLIEKLQS
ncbi:MAG: redoxin domain-containing protein [Chloroflexi bacterium]|nr:redoxin domain-containing protein [Chloroflexota bacterium]MCI0789520.1 redoxin domain-containing protein [Chloroflexota bacterium]MCI0896793.1 redoxin domain-containing protein [Chloroflexota bacterium]MCI0901434.1 redoxin domain-containing protein [Chloroflexota bacterium]MCI0902093.1 redoxin domain-containing protein [Chloroflexota bacterium]